MLKHESNLILYFLNLNNFFDSNFKFIDVEQNEIDCKKFEFETFEINKKIKFTTKIAFDLTINSKFDLIDIELKLILNFSNLNDLKNLIFDFDSKLSTTSIFYFIFF